MRRDNFHSHPPPRARFLFFHHRLERSADNRGNCPLWLWTAFPRPVRPPCAKKSLSVPLKTPMAWRQSMPRQRKATTHRWEPDIVEMTTRLQKMSGIDFHYPAQRLIQLYGSVSFQALRPCVAAYKSRALGTIVSPATSTMGSPVPAVAQLVEPFARIITPKSFET
jgi:hypothetical protein